MGFNCVIFLLCSALFKLNHCERLHGQIYSSIEGGAACFRRLNGTHQAGCSSSNKGAIGVVHMVKDVKDAQWIAYNATAGPYMAVISTALFRDVAELLMDNANNVAGILLYENATEKTTSYTQESKCPNEYASDPKSQCSSQDKNVWNVGGTGLLRRDIPFPIFYLPASRLEEITKIEQCYKRYNLNVDAQAGQPLCSIQLNSFMWAAVNTVVCRRRSAASAILSSTKVCDPLGDNNVYYSLFPRDKGSAVNKKVILVTSRIDTASLFDGVAPGAASSVVGMVTLISAAAGLSKMIPASDASKYDVNVLWTLLNGEAFDYIGSQRVAFDLKRGAWPPDAPLAPSDVKLHVEIGQIGGSLLDYKGNASWPIHAFAPVDAATSIEIREFLAIMSINMQNYNMSVTEEFTSNLPPSSLHSFRRILKNVTTSGTLPEVVFTDHGTTFTNLFYNSAMDDSRNIGYVYRNISIGTDGAFVSTDELLKTGVMTENDPQVKVARVATALTLTLFQKVSGKVYDGNLSVSAHLVDELLYCFLENKQCALLAAADYGDAPPSEEVPPRPAPLYVGVVTWANNAAAFAGHLLALLAGAHTRLDRAACAAAASPDNSYYWLLGWNHSGVCIETNMNFSEAISPAFITLDYDFASGEYSTWTESVWQAMWARVFVAAGGGGARAALGAGGALTALTAALTWWLRSRAHCVFRPPPPDAVPGILRTVNC